MRGLTLFLPLLVFAGCAQTPLTVERCPAGALSCDTVYSEPILRYAKGEEHLPGHEIQFGAESEYTVEEAGPLLSLYVPDPQVTGYSAKEWIALPAEKKVETLKQRKEELFPYRQPGRMTLTTNDPRLREILPPTLVYDVYNFEIVFFPTSSYEGLIKNLRYVEEKLGGGSLQLTFSTLRAKLKSAKDRTRYFAEQLGHLNFVNEIDTIEKLDSGFQKFRESPSSWAASSFNHPYLGPMVKSRQLKLKDWIRQVANGQDLTQEQIDSLSFIIDSSKFIGGVSFRPDVAQKQDRVAWEIRQCHRSLECIDRIARREIKFLENGYGSFKEFAGIESFDTVTAFDKVPRSERDFLRKLFPRTRALRIHEVELYRNFSYPLRDWSAFLSLGEGLPASVPAAQAKYLETLRTIRREYEGGRVSKKDAVAQVMGALSGFPRESGLLQVMQKQEKPALSSRSLNR